MYARCFQSLGLAFLLSALSASSFAQAQLATAPYKPEEGQEGKDVVWIPTVQPLVQMMLDMAKVTPEDYVIDLGSGDGRTVIAAAKRGARALGIEYNPQMIQLSRRNAARAGVSDKAQFVKADLFKSDLSRATVITMFLLPDLNIQLRPKILDLKPGTRIVSNTFDMDEWEPDKTAEITKNCRSHCEALFWVVPAKVEGGWELPQGELTLEQTFQMVSGTISKGGKSVPISDGKLRGDQLTFRAGDTQYVGRVIGNSIEGTASTGGQTSKFMAQRARPAEGHPDAREPRPHIK